MANLLRQFIRQYILEAVALTHAVNRLQNRFTDFRIITVGLEPSFDKFDQIEPVGVYNVPEEIIGELKSRFEILERTRFPKSKSYAVKLMDIRIDPNKIDYFDPSKRSQYNNKQMYKFPFVFINDNTFSKSIGNQIYAIVREGKIVTIMLAKNYVPMTTEKAQVNHVINNWDLIAQNSIR